MQQSCAYFAALKSLKSAYLRQMKNWIAAFRLRTLFLSFSCILMGIVLANLYGFSKPLLAFFSLLTALFLQILSNLANDYGDSIHGADHPGRKGPSRLVQAGHISKQQMKNAIVIFALLSLFSGSALLYLSRPIIGTSGALILFGMGLLAIAAAYYYTNGKKPYGYMGLGDASVFLFFGLLAVCGSFYLHSATLNFLILLPACCCGLLAVGVLNLNNMRDTDSDQSAGKISIPVRLGFEKAKYYHYALVVSACACMLLFDWLSSSYENTTWIRQVYLLSFLLFGWHLFSVFKVKDKQQFDPLLKQLSLSTFAFVLLFALSLL